MSVDEKDFKVVFGGVFGDQSRPLTTAWFWPKVVAIHEANERDTERRRNKPTRAELIRAYDDHIKTGEALSDVDARKIRDILVGKPESPGARKNSENAKLARDGLMYSEFTQLLGKSIPRERCKLKVGKKFGVSGSTVEAAITRMRKLGLP